MNKVSVDQIKEFVSPAFVSGSVSYEGLLESLAKYMDLLFEWNGVINLTAHKNLQEIGYKDLWEYLYLSQYLLQNKVELKSKKLADVGCGAGFGGLVLALLNAETNVTLIDSDRKKINFIKDVIRNLSLKGRVEALCGRCEDLDLGSYHYIVSRATWGLEGFARMMSGKISEDSTAIYLGSATEGVGEFQNKLGIQTSVEHEYVVPQFDQKRKFFLLKGFHVKSK